MQTHLQQVMYQETIPLKHPFSTPSTSNYITQTNVKEAAQTNNVNKLASLKPWRNIISTENNYQKQNISNLNQSLIANDNYFIPKSGGEYSD